MARIEDESAATRAFEAIEKSAIDKEAIAKDSFEKIVQSEAERVRVALEKLEATQEALGLSDADFAEMRAVGKAKMEKSQTAAVDEAKRNLDLEMARAAAEVDNARTAQRRGDRQRRAECAHRPLG